MLAVLLMYYSPWRYCCSFYILSLHRPVPATERVVARVNCLVSAAGRIVIYGIVSVSGRPVPADGRTVPALGKVVVPAGGTIFWC